MTIATPTINSLVPPKRLPFLESICWQTNDVYRFTPEEMLRRYERGWRYRSLFNNLEGEELDFLKELAKRYKSWLQEAYMTFRLEHHQKILTILESLDSEILLRGSAYFGGGTLLGLDFQEYRQSKDIDFLAPVGTEGYRYLRTVVFDVGYKALFRDLSRIQVDRGTTDQYGIRMMVSVGDEPIKMEIIAEARFELDPPRYPKWSPVPCLSFNDCFTSKLLSNADRFMDDSVESRDLIDLAMIRIQSPIPQVAIDKAQKAYEVIRPLKKAIGRFQQRPDYREKCFLGLQIDRALIPKIIDGIDLLSQDLGLSDTPRSFWEEHDLF